MEPGLAHVKRSVYHGDERSAMVNAGRHSGGEPRSKGREPAGICLSRKAIARSSRHLCRHNPPVQITGDLQRLLSEADRALGRLDGSVQTLPNPDLFVYMYVRKEAVLPARSRGRRVRCRISSPPRPSIFARSRPRDVDEVVNYVGAMKHGLARLADLPVSVRLIREIHAEAARRRARFPASRPANCAAVRTGSVRAAARSNEATFVPPPPAEVPATLGALETFLHAARRPAVAGEDRPGARAVRDHPSVPRRQRPRRAAADHLPAVRAAAR